MPGLRAEDYVAFLDLLDEQGRALVRERGRELRQALDPFYGDVAKGKGAHAVGRAGADIASLFFGGEIADAATAAGDSLLAGDAAAIPDATAAADTAPATLRDPPVGDVSKLSKAGQQAHENAIKDGLSPSRAYQEAQSLDQTVPNQAVRPAAPNAPPNAPANAPSGLPQGLSREYQQMYAHAIADGMTPQEALNWVRQLEEYQGPTGPEPTAGGTVRGLNRNGKLVK